MPTLRRYVQSSRSWSVTQPLSCQAQLALFLDATVAASDATTNGQAQQAAVLSALCDRILILESGRAARKPQRDPNKPKLAQLPVERDEHEKEVSVSIVYRSFRAPFRRPFLRDSSGRRYGTFLG